MSDEQNPDVPLGPSDHPGGDLVSADELEAVLAQASSVADDLSRQVGADSRSSGGVGVAADPPAVSALDAQLDELEHLVEVAGEELDDRLFGEAPVSPTEIGEALVRTPGDLSDTLAQDEDQNAVPDFMSEFVDSTDRPAEKTPPLASKAVSPVSPVSEKPGVVKTPALGVVGTPDMMAGKTIAEIEADATAERPDKMSLKDKMGGLIKLFRDRAAPLAVKMFDPLVAVLEAMHRPLDKMGDRVQLIVGYLGLATMGTALILYLYTLLMV